MSYIDELAAQIRQQVPPEVLPVDDTRQLFRMYALLALAKGTAVTPADVHNAWAVWMLERNPDHSAIRPFDELTAAAQASDEPFAEAIRSVAERLAADAS